MAKESYDVLKLIEQNQFCYESSEYVTGKSLPEWLKYHSQMEKQQLLRWVGEMFVQMGQIHRCHGNPCYRYVNPYSLIVDEERKIWFLDLGSESNREQVKRMQRRAIREYFLPPEEPYYQNESISLDYYGLGRTLQYLLAYSEPNPGLTKGEERKFRKVISKCLDWHSQKSIHEYSDIQNQIPKYKHKPRRKTKRTAKILIFLAILLLISAGAMIYQQWKLSEKALQMEAEMEENIRKKAKTRKSVQKKAEEGESPQKMDGDTADPDGSNAINAQMKLGLLYFLELSNYQKSSECFGALRENELANQMEVISKVMAGDQIGDEDFRKALQLAKAEADKQVQDKNTFYECILKGYSHLDTEQDARMRLKLATSCLEDADDEKKPEIVGIMAAAYEQLGQYKEAVQMYEEQEHMETDEKTKIGLYQKAAELFVQLGETEQAQGKLREGIRQYPKSAELRRNLIENQLSDPGITRGICMQTIQEALEECAELAGQEDFQKLMKQNGLRIEGGKICEEK